MHISTAIITKMVIDGANITINIKYEVEYGLLITVFRFDLEYYKDQD